MTTEAGKQLIREARPSKPLSSFPERQSWWGYRNWVANRVAAIEAEARADLAMELEAAAVLLAKVIESMQKNDPSIFAAILPDIHAFLDAYQEELG